jgi:aminoglycoside phosphotransferase (APT) family kinase protein
MRPLQHGYTNHTVGDDTRVEKTYAGPDAAERLARERAVVSALRGLLPVPAVKQDSGPDVDADSDGDAAAAAADVLTVRFERLPGTHGQELMEQRGLAGRVLNVCGRVLRCLHQVPAAAVFGRPAEVGQVVVHGDFGPNNMLLDPATLTVTALLDWEFAHVGSPIEDLAWCEWIVRAHHPRHLDALAQLYAGYGQAAPAWTDRQAAMVGRCVEL